MGWTFAASFWGAVSFLALFVSPLGQRARRRVRQVAWALVPVVSFSLLAWWPFLVLALIRRRARDWAVCAAYLAAVAAEVYLAGVGGKNNAPAMLAGAGALLAGLVMIAPIHALVAFRPAAGVPSLWDAPAARAAARRQQPVADAVAPEGWQQDAGPGDDPGVASPVLGAAGDRPGGGRGQMAADESRTVEFPKVLRGYWPDEVDGLLAARARLLDAGFPPAIFTQQPRFARVMRGYDPAAVDRFFDPPASGSTAQADRPGPANPWRVVCGEPEPHDGPGGQARHRGAARRQYARVCRAGWFRVADMPGTRLRRTSGQTGTILGGHGQILLTCRGGTLTIGDGGPVLRNDRARAQIVDAATGDPVLRWIGAHSHRQARTVVLLPQLRWLWFPVHGTRIGNAVMRAIDESGTEVVWFRKTQRTVTEAVVRPYCDVTPEILCLIECAASWLDAYFPPRR